jgi:hypothetical protein
MKNYSSSASIFETSDSINIYEEPHIAITIISGRRMTEELKKKKTLSFVEINQSNIIYNTDLQSGSKPNWKSDFFM